MSKQEKFHRRESKEQRRRELKEKSLYVRTSVKIQRNHKKDLMKKSGLSFQKSIEKLVKEYLNE